ncbi:hypothetical protein EV13_1596 [Prochlorococcus sp. MIT 0702]|nr:hypothetical protein EV13_1596 [Prochlorococcus sp. MIT 0702]KGG28659.1 hypothetical protein EV12_0554 [Prochlorococcus sp. MIT 0701]KGG36304.1 hypothetical protein EV14_0398 [Prochlorococcus sp. MIT 0703]
MLQSELITTARCNPLARSIAWRLHHYLQFEDFDIACQCF